MAASNNESTTIGSYFGYGTTSSTYTWVRIKSYPDLGGEPNTVEVTDLSDRMQRFLKGVQSSNSLSFTANYVPSTYATLAALEGSKYCAVYFGDSAQGTPTGSMGKFTWQGEISVYANGGSVDSAREMTITCVPSTAIAFAAE